MKALGNFLEAGHKAFYQVLEEGGITDRTGALFGAFNIASGKSSRVPDISFKIDSIDNSQAIRYSDHLVEKAIRLGEHPEHVCSSQSADDKLDKYGGAANVDEEWRFVLSGLEQGYQDEAVVVLAGVYAGTTPVDRAREIARITGNSLLLGILNNHWAH